jgi:hypothetical protein
MSQPYNPYAQQPAAPQQVPGGFVPQAPQQGYQPAPQGYYPQQQFAPQGYPQQGYGQPAPQPPAPPLAQGSLDAFYKQPTVGGGAALKFDTPGTTHVFVVARDVTDADVVQQTQMGTNIPATFRDGSPMYQLIVPVILPDGNAATWYVKGATREVLLEAMAKAGCPAGTYPKKGDAGRVTWASSRPTRFGNQAKIYTVDWTRADQAGGGMNTAQQFSPAAQAQPAHPAGVAGATALAQPAPQQFQPQAPAQQYAPAPQQPQGFVQQAPEQPMATPGVAAPPAGYMPQGMDPNSPEFAAFQRLLGQAGQPQ